MDKMTDRELLVLMKCTKAIRAIPPSEQAWVDKSLATKFNDYNNSERIHAKMTSGVVISNDENHRGKGT